MIIIITLISTILFATLIACLAKHTGPYLLQSFYAGSLVTAIYVAGKLFDASHLGLSIGLSASILVYSATFILTDVLSEIYGPKEARKAIIGALCCYPIVAISTQFAVHVPAHAHYGANEAFSSVMGFGLWIVFASVIGFTCSQFTDITIYHLLKKVSKRKMLWLRNNGSTIVSQLIDTVVFYSIAFYGVFPIGQIIIYTVIAKVAIAAVDTPFVYFVRSYHEKYYHFTDRLFAGVMKRIGKARA